MNRALVPPLVLLPAIVVVPFATPKPTGDRKCCDIVRIALYSSVIRWFMFSFIHAHYQAQINRGNDKLMRAISMKRDFPSPLLPWEFALYDMDSGKLFYK